MGRCRKKRAQAMEQLALYAENGGTTRMTIHRMVFLDSKRCEGKCTIVFPNMVLKIFKLLISSCEQPQEWFVRSLQKRQLNHAMLTTRSKLRITWLHHFLGKPVKGTAMTTLMFHTAEIMTLCRFNVRLSCDGHQRKRKWLKGNSIQLFRRKEGMQVYAMWTNPWHRCLL